MYGSPTRVSSRHFAVTSQNLETSGAQPCGGDGNDLACNCGVEGQGDVKVSTVSATSDCVTKD